VGRKRFGLEALEKAPTVRSAKDHEAEDAKCDTEESLDPELSLRWLARLRKDRGEQIPDVKRPWVVQYRIRLVTTNQTDKDATDSQEEGESSRRRGTIQDSNRGADCSSHPFPAGSMLREQQPEMNLDRPGPDRSVPAKSETPEPIASILSVNFGGQGQNRTADTKIFSLRSHDCCCNFPHLSCLA
jgi:hypothetical protein